MDKHLGYYIGISKSTELILMTAFSLWFNICDMAIFEMKSNINEIWSIQLDQEVLSPNAQLATKYIISGIIFVRALTLHLYIALLIPCLWPMVFNTQPGLMLPWLIVSAIKNIFTNVLSLLTGSYTCILFGPARPACFEFFAYHATHFLPSLYMWVVGLSFYRDLKCPPELIKPLEIDKSELEFNVAVRRRMTKSMADENIIRSQLEAKTKNIVGTSALNVEEIFKWDLWERAIVKQSRSMDTLLDILSAEAEMSDWELPEPLDEGLSIQERAIMLLGITKSEIDEIIKSKRNSEDNENKVFQMQRRSLGQNADTPVTSFIYKAKTSFHSHNRIPVKAIKSEVNIPQECLQRQVQQSKHLEELPELVLNQVSCVDTHENQNGNDQILYIKKDTSPLFDTSKAVENIIVSIRTGVGEQTEDKFRCVKKVEVASDVAGEKEDHDKDQQIERVILKSSKKFIVDTKSESLLAKSKQNRARSDGSKLNDSILEKATNKSTKSAKQRNVKLEGKQSVKESALTSVTSKIPSVEFYSRRTPGKSSESNNRPKKIETVRNLSNIPLYQSSTEQTNKSNKSRLRNRKTRKDSKDIVPPEALSVSRETSESVEFASSSSNKIAAAKSIQRQALEPAASYSKPERRINLKDLADDSEDSHQTVLQRPRPLTQGTASSHMTKLAPRGSLKNADEYNKESYRDKLVRNLNKSTGKFGLLSERVYMEDGYSRMFDERLAQKRLNHN